VSGVRFEYCPCFTQILTAPVPIIRRFTTSVVIKCASECTQVEAKFDRSVQMQLTPSLLLKLSDIGTLFVPDPKRKYLHKLNKRRVVI
jgi:hypothetical protein